jgi:predicted metal-dependent hydrolase
MSQTIASESRTPESVNIEIRKFDKTSFENTPEYFWDNDPFKTHLINGLSILFPEGERFFIKSVLNYRDRITDEKLLKEVKEFSAQEAQHTLIHEAMNELPLKYGYPVEECEEAVGQGLHTFLEMAKKNKVIKRAALATTVCMEHFTAILAYQVLTNGDEMLEGLDPNVRSLFEWHAIEETEHKAVAFDVYQATGGGAIFLRVALLWSTAMFLFGAFYNITRMLMHDGNIKKWSTWKTGFKFMFGRDQGFLIRPFSDWLAFFKPGFHPWKQHQDLDFANNLSRLDAYILADS